MSRLLTSDDNELKLPLAKYKGSFADGVIRLGTISSGSLTNAFGLSDASLYAQAQKFNRAVSIYKQLGDKRREAEMHLV